MFVKFCTGPRARTEIYECSHATTSYTVERTEEEDLGVEYIVINMPEHGSIKAMTGILVSKENGRTARCEAHGEVGAADDIGSIYLMNDFGKTIERLL